MKPFLLVATLLVAGVAQANPKPVRVVWGLSSLEDAPHVEGYNVQAETISQTMAALRLG